jgi:hypothetical protein
MKLRRKIVIDKFACPSHAIIAPVAVAQPDHNGSLFTSAAPALPRHPGVGGWRGANRARTRGPMTLALSAGVFQD